MVRQGQKPAEQQPVDRFFELSLFGMLASGYMAVAGSGQLTPPVLALTASAIGPPKAIGAALAATAVFSAWSVVTTPTDAKHLAVRRRPLPAVDAIVLTDPTPVLTAPSPAPPPDTVVDLVAMESDEQPAAGLR